MFIVRDSDNSTVLTDFTPRKMISFQTLEKKKKPTEQCCRDPQQRFNAILGTLN